jgi:hypothetical protein
VSGGRSAAPATRQLRPHPCTSLTGSPADVGKFFVYGPPTTAEPEDAGDAQGPDNIAAPQSIKL